MTSWANWQGLVRRRTRIEAGRAARRGDVHSLEDRIGQALHRRSGRRRDRLASPARGSCAHATFRKAGGGVTAGDAEVAANPRAVRPGCARRSAPRRQRAAATFDLRPSKASWHRPAERGEHVFRTSDIVLIAVMVSAAALTTRPSARPRNSWRRCRRSTPRSAMRRTRSTCSRPTGACSPSRRGCRSWELYKSQLELEPVSARQIVGIGDLPAKALDIQDI